MAAALVAALAMPAYAGGGLGGSLSQMVDIAGRSKLSSGSVVGDISFGNISGEFDRANSAVDLHGVYGTQYNRVLGGLVKGDDRPTTLFTGLSNNNQQNLFQFGITGPAGEGGAYAVSFTTGSNSNDFSGNTFGNEFDTEDESVDQLQLTYGRMVKDHIWVGGSICLGEQDEEDFEQNGTGFVNTDIFRDESSFQQLDVAAKIIGDNHALAFGINYGMAEFEDSFTEIDDNNGAIDTDFQGIMLERDGFGGFIRYTEQVSDTLEWELSGGFDMHSAELDDPTLSSFIPDTGSTSDQVSTNDDITFDSYSVRGTLLHRPHDKVDMYYSVGLGMSEADGELDTDFRTDGTVDSSQFERVENETTNYSVDLTARYFVTKKTAVTFGATYRVFDSEFDSMIGPGGGPATQFQASGNEFSDTNFRAALTHVLNQNFRFDIGYYEDSFSGNFINGGLGNGGGGNLNSGVGDFVNFEQFRASVTASF